MLYQSAKKIDPPSAALDTEESLSLEEKLRRERQRQMTVGMTNYAWSQNTTGPQRILALLQVWRNIHWPYFLVVLFIHGGPRQGNIYVAADSKSEFKLLFDKVSTLEWLLMTDAYIVAVRLRNTVRTEFDWVVGRCRGPTLFAGRNCHCICPGTTTITVHFVTIIPAQPPRLRLFRMLNCTRSIFPAAKVRARCGMYWIQLFASALHVCLQSSNWRLVHGPVGRPTPLRTSLHRFVCFDAFVQTMADKWTFPSCTDTRNVPSDYRRWFPHVLLHPHSQEEMDRYRGYWWSPDTTKIAFIEVRGLCTRARSYYLQMSWFCSFMTVMSVRWLTQSHNSHAHHRIALRVYCATETAGIVPPSPPLCLPPYHLPMARLMRATSPSTTSTTPARPPRTSASRTGTPSRAQLTRNCDWA